MSPHMERLIANTVEMFERARAYDEAMMAAERAPTGDDYNELCAIFGLDKPRVALAKATAP